MVMHYHIGRASELYKYYILYMAKNTRMKSLRQQHDDDRDFKIMVNLSDLHLHSLKYYY